MKNLFVGNLSFGTTESDLRTLFQPFGQLSRVHIAMDRETGKARGFAFIEMPNDDEAKKAIAGLDGKELGGRNIKVNEARPKTAGPAESRGRGPSSGNGRPGGGRPGGGGGRSSFSTENYGDAARQPREPRW
jgi:cold-inducible RNA-binding protein